METSAGYFLLGDTVESRLENFFLHYLTGKVINYDNNDWSLGKWLIMTILIDVFCVNVLFLWLIMTALIDAFVLMLTGDHGRENLR